MNEPNTTTLAASRGYCRAIAVAIFAMAWLACSERTVRAGDETPQQPAAISSTKVEPKLHIGKLEVSKVLILGNSITLHGPAPAIGWNGNWGMAASALEKDYVHLLLDQLAQVAGGKPKAMVKNIADFERGLKGFDLQQGLQPELAFEADLIILAIGENVGGLTTDDAKTKFREAFANLLAELKKHGRPTIFVRGTFWPDAAKDAIMKQACEAAGGHFVDITKLGGDEANYARSERKLEHAGVAAHPGDKGMQAIANALWSAIQQHAMPMEKSSSAAAVK